jgi:hypothetical protein
MPMMPMISTQTILMVDWFNGVLAPACAACRALYFLVQLPIATTMVGL